MAFEQAHAAIDDMVAQTFDRLAVHRASGGDDVDFQAAMVGSFYAEAQRHEPGAGAAHMALAVYRLALQHQHINELADRIAMFTKTLDELEAL